MGTQESCTTGWPRVSIILSLFSLPHKRGEKHGEVPTLQAQAQGLQCRKLYLKCISPNMHGRRVRQQQRHRDRWL